MTQTNGLTLAEADRRDGRAAEEALERAEMEQRALILPIRETARLAILETIRDTKELTELEWRFVRYLQRYEGQIRTYHQIAQHLWGTRENPITPANMANRNGYASPYVRHIWVLAFGVRHKLEFDPGRPQHLATRRLAGYSWHDLPPSQGFDYRALHTEHVKLAALMRYAFGYSDNAEDGEGLPRYPQLGPAHQHYEGEVVESSSSAGTDPVLD